MQMVSLYKDPKGENVFAKTDITNKSHQLKSTRVTVGEPTEQGSADI